MWCMGCWFGGWGPAIFNIWRGYLGIQSKAQFGACFWDSNPHIAYVPVGLCMGHGNTELIRKTEPKLSRTENTVDFLTLSEPNRTGKIFWYGSGSYMLSIPRTVPNCTELKNRN